jgi:hypothetical protein
MIENELGSGSTDRKVNEIKSGETRTGVYVAWLSRRGFPKTSDLKTEPIRARD